jgi:hypothetical protein
MTEPDLSPAETLRYARHLVLDEVGEAGQRRLKAARVLIVGAGGLGSPASLYLAAAGVGTLGLVDFDDVDASNLQRQVLYGESDLGRPKLDAALERLRDLNPHVRLVPHPERLTSANALDIIRGLRHRDRRDRQLPDPLPRERRLRAPGEAQRLRLHPQVRGPALRLRRRRRRALLPVPLPRAAAARAGPQLRRGRRPRRAARRDRVAPGAGGHQAHHRRRRAHDRPAPPLRRPQAQLAGAQAAPQP